MYFIEFLLFHNQYLPIDFLIIRNDIALFMSSLLTINKKYHGLTVMNFSHFFLK